MKLDDVDPTKHDTMNFKLKSRGRKHVRYVTLKDDRYCLNKDGWFRERMGGKRERICGFIRFLEHRSILGSDRIQLALQFRDVNRARKLIVVDRSEILSSYTFIDHLVNCGFEIGDRVVAAQVIRQAYSKYPPKTIVATAQSPGWHLIQSDGIEVYVTNNGTIKPARCNANIVLAAGIVSGFASSGSLNEWNNKVAALCKGNSRLQFGICMTLASIVLRFSDLPNFGALIEGPSKAGKTVTLRAGGSVMGSENYMLSWNSTANALERIAVVRNDGLLPLDEIGQGDPNAVSESVYDLMNGKTKSRLGADTRLESGTRFRGLVLASGELDLRTHLGQAGIKAKEGQLVRLFSVPVPTQGVFSKLHGYKSRSAHAAALVQNMAKYYGTLGPAFIAYVAEHQAELKAELPDMVGDNAASLLQLLKSVPEPGTYGHVAKCFALVAIAGELAISQNLLAWEKGSAKSAVAKCFKAWAKREKEITAMSDDGVFRQLQRFFQSEKVNKFVPMAKFENAEKTTLAGYTHTVDGAPAYLVYPAFFETKLCARFGKRVGIRVLKERNLLVLGPRMTPTRQVNVPKDLQGNGHAKVSFYVIRERILRA